MELESKEILLVGASSDQAGYDSIVNYVQNNEPFGDLSFNFLPPKFKGLLENKERFEELILHWDLGLRLRIIARKT